MKKIEETYDYTKFKRLAGNREVSEQRIKKIIESINKVGYITSPIIVNEKYEVIDGQGRLQALKQLKLPVEYIIHPGSGINECLSMNINQTNWSILDYIHSYAERGLSSYVLLERLIDMFPNINTLSIIKAADGRKTTKKIYNGELILTEEKFEKAIEILQYVNEIIPHIKYLNGGVNYLIQALMECYEIDEVNKDRLKEIMLNKSSELKNWNTLPSCLQSIEDLYNRNIKIPVFIYTEYRKGLYAKLKGRMNKAERINVKYKKHLLDPENE